MTESVNEQRTKKTDNNKSKSYESILGVKEPQMATPDKRQRIGTAILDLLCQEIQENKQLNLAQVVLHDSCRFRKKDAPKAFQKEA